MIFATPSISADQARRRIEYRWWHRLWPRNPVTGPKPHAHDAPPLPRLELVCLPYHLVTVETTFSGRARDITTSVEGYSGAFAVFDAKRVPCSSVCEHPPFPPRIGATEAGVIACHGLQLALLRNRGGSRRPVVGQVRRVEMLGYPYWVYYYERRKGRLDIKVLDAVTGGPPGPKIKTSLLTAFIDARSTQGANRQSCLKPER